MNTALRTSALAAVIFSCAGPSLKAQELTFLGGLLPETRNERSTYTWQVDYRQDIYRNFASSIAYINEGHLRAHHRDGTAWEIWGREPFFNDRFAVSAGLGAYYFYDTQPVSSRDTANVHGTALIYSLAVTGYLSDRWFYRVNYNHIRPANDIKVSTVTAGAGFWFGQNNKPIPGALGDAPEEEAYVTENELTMFLGQSVVNTFGNPTSRAYAGEFRRGVFSHIDWTASAIYEGDPRVVRRNGAATQLWVVNTFFDHRIAVGAGLGPYVFLDHKHPAGAGAHSPAAIAPLVSLTCSVRISEYCVVRMVFNRVTSNYNRDSDIFLIGIGCRWPR